MEDSYENSAPTPGLGDELNDKITKFMEIELDHQGIKYILKIKSNKEYLYLEVNEENNIIYFYQVVYNLSNLIQFDKMFKVCDNMDEAYELMNSNIKNDKPIIKSIENNKLILIFNILQANRSILAKEMKLTKKYNKQEVVIEKLSEQIKDLKIKQKNMEQEITDLKIENEKLKNQNKNIGEINELKEKLNYYFDKSIIKSTIIQDLKKFEFIKERLYKVKFNGKESNKLNFELIYRAKIYGDNARDFHSRCDLYRNTLTIIKTKEGLIFGGFTSQTWEGKDFDKEDENAFCFSVNNKKIYNCIKGKKAIYASPTQGPTFQNCIFEIKDKCFESGGSCDPDISSHYDNVKEEFEINGGKNHFLVDDLEVFFVYPE